MSNEDWIINLQNLSREVNADFVQFVLNKYGAKCVEDIPASFYSDVWMELDDIYKDQ